MSQIPQYALYFYTLLYVLNYLVHAFLKGINISNSTYHKTLRGNENVQHGITASHSLGARTINSSSNVHQPKLYHF